MDVFTALSLCSGYEGLGLGLKRAIPNIRTVCYVERETFAVANLVAKIKAGKLDDAPIWDDLATFDPKPFTGMVHIIHGGYPCQGFSVAGKRLGLKDPRWVWPYIARIVQAVRPVWCFFENVSGHLTIGFPEVYRSLRDMGYSVEAGIFSAAEVGAPHKRERLFILAHDSNRQGNTAIISEPAKTAQPESGNDLRKSQLANTRHSTRCPKHGQQQKECAEELSGRDKLGNAGGTEPGRLSGSQRQRISEIRQTSWPSRPGQPQYEWEVPRLVDNAMLRRPRRKKEEICSRRDGTINSSQGQTQSRLGRISDGDTYSLDIAKGIRGGYYVKPGGEIGHDLVMEAKQRVDRLRLLGNGVVPQCAEKAFRELIKKFQ